MPPGKRVRCGIAVIAVLAALLGAAVPLATPASTQDQEELALELFNKQSCALHYQDDPQTVAQATSSPSASPAPVTTPGLPYPPPGVSNGTYTVNRTPPPNPGATPGVSPPPVPGATPSPTTSTEPIFLIRGGETPPPIPPAGQATPAPTPA
ncbi:MAG: hypothetical protein WCC84_03335, partial [Candidatus Cybelea sp.]